jgi:hypothetical protein
MGETGKRDKGQREQRKKPKLTIKEKRRLKHEKQNNPITPSITDITKN